MYYGVNTDTHYQVNFQDDSDEDDILSIGFVDGFQVACNAERYPALDGAVVELQEKLEDGDWQTVGEESVIIIVLTLSTEHFFVIMSNIAHSKCNEFLNYINLLV